MSPEEKVARIVIRKFLEGPGVRRFLSAGTAKAMTIDVLARQLRENASADSRLLSLFGSGDLRAEDVLLRVREDIVARARNGDRLAHSAIEKVALEFINDGAALPEPMRSYHIDVCEGRRPRLRPSQSPAFNVRNWVLGEAVRRGTELGISDREACRIVQYVLSEMKLPAPNADNIRQIWKPHKRNPSLWL